LDEAVEADVLGQSYEYLIKKFADQTNKKAGEFYTPRSIVRLMIEILDPQPGETICDPACGTGGMLLEAVNHVRRMTGDVKTLRGKLFGQERNLTTSGIARINLFMHGVEDFEIVRGDTLRSPAFFEGDRLARFDLVIANPPFSLENWGEENWINDSFGRNFAGVPPAKSGDFAWVQHMIRSLAARTGRMAIVLPHGALFRSGAEGQIRKRILELDVLEAVIGAGPNLFYGTGLAACILIFRRQKAAERKNQVLFIDASTLFKRGRNQNTLEPEHITRILELYGNYKTVAGLAKIANLEEIEKNDWNLNVSRYVDPLAAENTMSVTDALAKLKNSLEEAYAAEEKLKLLLHQYTAAGKN
jgi:type I restriction enzyme M protein